jgi:hypothetical protein
MPLHQLISGLTGLTHQGISVRRSAVGENVFIFEVMVFKLTAEQIVKLRQR